VPTPALNTIKIEREEAVLKGIGGNLKSSCIWDETGRKLTSVVGCDTARGGRLPPMKACNGRDPSFTRKGKG